MGAGNAEEAEKHRRDANLQRTVDQRQHCGGQQGEIGCAIKSNQIKSNQINRRVATNGGSDRHVISHWHDARQIKHTTQAGPSPKLRLRLRLWLWLWLGLKLDLP